MSAEKDEDFLNHEEEEEDIEELFTCKYCEFQTKNIDELDEHIIIHDEAVLEENVEESGQEDNVQVQAQRPKKTTTNAELEHSKANIKKEIEFSVKPLRVRPNTFLGISKSPVSRTVFVCPYCSLQTTRKGEMNKHLESHTSPVEVPIYSCSECSYATRRKCDMPKHLLTHCKDGNVTMYPCPHCSYSTKRKGDLPKHLLGHQSYGDNQFTCHLCPYVTRRKGDLKKHVMSHEAEPYIKDGSIYNCTECGYTSKRLNDLHKHVVLHRDKFETDFFKCTKCDYSTTVSNHFAKHVLTSCQSQERSNTVSNRSQKYIVLEGADMGIYEVNKKGMVKRKRERAAAVADSDDDEQEDFLVDRNFKKRSKVVVLGGYEEPEQSS